MGVEDRAADFHEESSEIAKELLDRAVGWEYHTIYDSQMTNFPLAQRQIQRTLKNDGHVTVAFTNIDAVTSAVRTGVRFMAGETRRQIPLDVILKGYNRGLPTFIGLWEKYKNHPNVDFVLVDNNADGIGRPPRRVFEKIEGETQVFDQDLLDNLMSTRYNIIGKGEEARYERAEKETPKTLAEKDAEIRRRQRDTLADKGYDVSGRPLPGKGIQRRPVPAEKGAPGRRIEPTVTLTFNPREIKALGLTEDQARILEQIHREDPEEYGRILRGNTAAMVAEWETRRQARARQMGQEPLVDLGQPGIMQMMTRKTGAGEIPTEGTPMPEGGEVEKLKITTERAAPAKRPTIEKQVLTPEQERAEKWIGRNLEGKRPAREMGENPRLMMTGGPPGAGKSTGLKLPDEFKSKAVRVDSDIN